MFVMMKIYYIFRGGGCMCKQLNIILNFVLFNAPTCLEPNTLLRIQEHWIPEVRKHRPDAPILLCGCMAKLR